MKENPITEHSGTETGGRKRFSRPGNDLLAAYTDIWYYRREHSARYQALQVELEALRVMELVRNDPLKGLFEAYAEALGAWEGVYTRAVWVQGVMAAAAGAYDREPWDAQKKVRSQEETELEDCYTCLLLALPREKRRRMQDHYALERKVVESVDWYAFVHGYEWMLELQRLAGLKPDEGPLEGYYQKLD